VLYGLVVGAWCGGAGGDGGDQAQAPDVVFGDDFADLWLRGGEAVKGGEFPLIRPRVAGGGIGVDDVAAGAAGLDGVVLDELGHVVRGDEGEELAGAGEDIAPRAAGELGIGGHLGPGSDVEASRFGGPEVVGHVRLEYGAGFAQGEVVACLLEVVMGQRAKHRHGQGPSDAEHPWGGADDSLGEGGIHARQGWTRQTRLSQSR